MKIDLIVPIINFHHEDLYRRIANLRAFIRSVLLWERSSDRSCFSFFLRMAVTLLPSLLVFANLLSFINIISIWMTMNSIYQTGE